MPTWLLVLIVILATPVGMWTVTTASTGSRLEIVKVWLILACLVLIGGVFIEIVHLIGFRSFVWF